MASRNVLVLIAIALVPFAIARQNPSDKEASQTDLTQKDGLYEPLNKIIIIKPHPKPPFCWKKLATAEGTDVYEPSGLKFPCPPPPAPTPSPTTGPVPTPAPTPAPTQTSLAPTPTSPTPTRSSPVPAPAPIATPGLLAPTPAPIATPGLLAPTPAPVAIPIATLSIQH